MGYPNLERFKIGGKCGFKLGKEGGF